jgi:hypothetical protein
MHTQKAFTTQEYADAIEPVVATLWHHFGPEPASGEAPWFRLDELAATSHPRPLPILEEVLKHLLSTTFLNVRKVPHGHYEYQLDGPRWTVRAIVGMDHAEHLQTAAVREITNLIKDKTFVAVICRSPRVQAAIRTAIAEGEVDVAGLEGDEDEDAEDAR